MTRLFLVALLLCVGCRIATKSSITKDDSPAPPLPQEAERQVRIHAVEAYGMSIVTHLDATPIIPLAVLPMTGKWVVKVGWDYSTNANTRWPTASRVEIKTNLTDAKWTLYRTITFTNGMTNYSCIITGAMGSGFIWVSSL